MSLLNKIRGEFIDIIEWNDPSTDTMVWRFHRYQDEIKNGAQLIVRPGQMAVFVSEGQIADVFSPGTHQLETANLPVLTSLKSWKYALNSPFKAEVYFTNTKLFTDQKWGTSNPIIVQDPELGVLRIKAYGNFVVRITDSALMLKQLIGTNSIYSVKNIHSQLRAIIVSTFANILGEAQIPATSLSAHYQDLAKLLRNQVAQTFAEFGLEINNVFIENISLPLELSTAIDKKSSMNTIGDLDKFSQYQAATAMEKAAENPGSAGAAMGMGVGFAMSPQTQSAPQNVSPPPPPVGEWWVALNGKRNGPHSLEALKKMIAEGTINSETPTWKPKLADWKKAHNFPELKDALDNIPPPLK